MTDKELLEKTAKRLRVIADDTQRITSGNISHNLTCLRGFALRAAESIEQHLQEPVSEELDEAAKAFAKVERSDDTEVGYDLNRYCGFVAGAGWKTEQLMAKAVNVTVHIDAGGYPYIPQMELYNHEKDIPLAKEGDKYKVILIKEG